MKFDRARALATLRPARLAAYPPGEFVGQESFVAASEIRALAGAAGIGPASRVLDLCCGAGGLATFLAAETGCRIIGLDRDPAALRVARSLAHERGVADRAEFVAGLADRPPLTGPHDVVTLFETVLAFPDKAGLIATIVPLIAPGGRLVVTVETGAPLAPAERRSIPGGETIWPVPADEFAAILEKAGLAIRLSEDHTTGHARRAARLRDTFGADRTAIAADLGTDFARHLIDAHIRWVEWLATRRIRKLAVVAEKVDSVPCRRGVARG